MTATTTACTRRGRLASTLLASSLLAFSFALAACTSDESTETAPDRRQPVTFDTYVQGSTTRAGATGVISTTKLQTEGFGVFAYHHTAGTVYGISATPNFMYNQKVSGEGWTYEPLKYWPNQDGNAKNGSEPQTDRLSFFAYAPYVSTPPDPNTWGITALTDNSTVGDAKVTYKVGTKLDESVDLLWATGPTGNLTKQAVNEKVKFYFHHALAALNMTVQAMVDQVNITDDGSDESSVGTLGSKHKITIKEVVVERVSTDALHATGVLNLNNTAADTPLWESTTGEVKLTLMDDEITEDFLDNFDSNFSDLHTGVTEEAKQQLYSGNALPLVTTYTNRFFMVIPPDASVSDGKRDYKVTMTYYITTEDTNLAAGYARSTNVATSTIRNLTLQAGKIYNLNFVLGLQTFQLGVSSVAWDTPGTETDVPVEIIYERGTSASSSLSRQTPAP